MSRKKTKLSELNLKKIGHRIAFIRLKAGEKQEEFGKRVEISKGNVSDMENCKHNPSYIPIVRIIEKYSVNPEWLLFGEGDIYNKDKGGDIPEGDPHKDLLVMTREILVSETEYSNSLAANIKSFHSAIETKRELSDHAKRLAALEEIFQDKAEGEKEERLEKKVM